MPDAVTIGIVPAPEDLLAQIKGQIQTVRSFQSGRVNKYGKVEGVREYPAGAAPFERQDHHLDARGRVVYLEKFTRDFSKPTVRCYRYQDATSALTEAIWLDRYGRIENYHRYQYDDTTGLLVWRAEYDHEGKLFYSIKSRYDAKNQLVDESWFDPRNRFMKRYAYTYDAKGELSGELHYDSRDILQGFNRFKYDAKGNLLERAWCDPHDKVMSRFEYSVDKDGRVQALKLYGPGGKLQVRQEFTHDAKNNVVREKWFDDKGALVKDLRF